MEIFKSFHENTDGSVEIDGKNFKLEEFWKLQRLMPTMRWVGIMYPRPEVITNYAYQPSADHAAFLENYKKDPSKFLKLNKPMPSHEDAS